MSWELNHHGAQARPHARAAYGAETLEEGMLAADEKIY